MRKRVLAALIFPALLLLGLSTALPASAAPLHRVPAQSVGGPWFEPQVGVALQVVSVESTGGSRANVTAWQRTLTGWQPVVGPVPGWVGSRGIAPAARDGIPATPAGVFSLGPVFGTAPPPGGLLPYRRIGGNDWWVGDARSPLFNTHQVCAPGRCPFNESASENLQIPQYEYSVVMGVNPGRVPGGGSAFFMHLTDGTPTLGCVALDRGPLVQIIRWLAPGAVIAIR
ncbi:L,D-transpeptidase family protein [Aldersonia kunmingensis]|uniref:L,D-transpeptidase family protein n=1 Tax=Aldersonia kunmingensis TaxID=408066 RepID=UPI00082FC8C5|nr:hypothetical protein [Aldersonia kunmingensis]